MINDKRVLVIGGGIGGTEACIALRKKGFFVHLVSDREFLYVYPLSIWIPTKEAKFNDVSIPLEKIAKGHGFSYEVSKVTSVEPDEVVLENGKRYQKGRDFDYLVIALGQDKLKPKGIEYTYSICGSPEETVKYSMALERLIQKGKGKLAFGFGGNPKAKEAVRGGPVFEVLFNVDNMLRKKYIRHDFELSFFAPMEKPGARLGEKALKMLDYMFKKKRIKKYVGKKIKEFLPDGVLLEDGTKIESDLTLFTPAGDGHPVIKQSQNIPKTEAGFIKIDKTCQVEGLDHVYAIGDCVALEGPEWKAKQGHLAEVMAHNVAHNIALKEGIIQGKPEYYTDHLNIMCLMDTGDGGALAYRDDKTAVLIPMPVIGHIGKKMWGLYYKLYKTGKIPKLL